MQIRKKPKRKSYWLICIIALIFILPFFSTQTKHVSAVGCASSNTFVVQCTAANTAGTISNSGTTSTITVTSGNSLIVVAGFASGNTQNTILTCTDNLAQSWTQLIQQNVQPLTGKAQTSVICYKTNTVGGSDAFTVTANTAAQGLIVIAAYEVKPTLTFNNALTNFCKQPFGSSACNVNSLGGHFCGSFSDSWQMGFSNASLVLSVMGGTSAGTDDNFTGSGFSQIVQRNIIAGTNSSQMIAEGNGAYSDSCVPPTGNAFSGVVGAFGPFTSSTTTSSQNTALISGSINELVAFVAWLIPSLVIIFLFTWLGIRAGAGTEMVLVLEIFAFAIIGVLGWLFGQFLNSSVWPPFWISVLGIIFCIVGLSYSKGRVH